MTNITTTTTVVLAAVVASIFDRLPGEAYDASNDRLVKGHMVKVSNNNGEAKVCDLVDLRLAAEDWHAIEDEGLIVEGTDGPIDSLKAMYKILNGLHHSGLTWDEIKASLVDEEEAWI